MADGNENNEFKCPPGCHDCRGGDGPCTFTDYKNRPVNRLPNGQPDPKKVIVPPIL